MSKQIFRSESGLIVSSAVDPTKGPILEFLCTPDFDPEYALMVSLSRAEVTILINRLLLWQMELKNPSERA